MNKRLIRSIFFLVGLLFANIEAAHAGLVGKFKMFIHAEFPDYQFYYWLLIFSLVSFFTYVVFVPVKIGKENMFWLNHLPEGKDPRSFKYKRNTVRNISHALNKGK